MAWELFSASRHLNPSYFLFVQIFTLIYVVGFTPARSIIRWKLLPVVGGSSFIVVQKIGEYVCSPAKVAIGCLSVCFVFLYLEVGILSKWSFEYNGPTENTAYSKLPSNGKLNGQKPLFKYNERPFFRIIFGLKSSLSFRDLNTPYEVKGIPPFSRKNLNYIPSRKEFLVYAISKVLVYYFLCKLFFPLVRIYFPSGEVPLSPTLDFFTDNIITRFRESVIFLVHLYLQLDAAYHALATVSVGLDLSEPWEWKPFMGTFRDAYTIRNFWR